MYVRSVNVSLENGNAYDLVDELQNNYLPQLAAQPGFLCYYAVVTGVAGIATVRIFTDVDSLQAAGDAVYDAAAAIADSYGLSEAVSYEGDANLFSALPELLEL